ncbi:2-polyprenyl-6-methoxyphenol hydroxylase-like FAD-dependent oxidoreductase [Thermocatellispora tengchongensis]|uniref:2-polyprenyl-6-methoxyphenol hydroxylase-like FAD-dependent oxidoreductase n=1 Tax=Thermocatellispora tengchongensis TaxID=1073253 RepID=A0A840NP91_9ACTN|nr:FAD-dependent monooxygenase [Thermocatellispora tengchongensis]MBB5130334.1 2-polyprenyl-6-methoxyphenol hydroxylase-like FAD-dependent oxidoreductase [Thermocatellispora tengchongensis]
MKNKDVLISGASIAGPMLAHWLVRHGFRPVVVERADRPREGGYPIDVRGPAVRIAERMGVLPELKAAAVRMSRMEFVDGRGRRTAGVDVGALRRLVAGRDIELPRGDLVSILYRRIRDDVEYVFGDSISAMTDDGDGVAVTFDSGAERRFGLVAGADGLHSAVRGLAFGPEERYAHHLGYYVAAADVPADRSVPGDHVVMHNSPGRMTAVYTYLGRATAMFVFTAPALRLDHRDTDGQKEALRRAFAGGGWRIAELLDRVTSAPDFYFDTVSQIRMPGWSAGRAVLVGDAAHCPALLSGQGTTLAMAGAYVLARELAAAGGDHRVAFARYERAHRPLVTRNQRKAGTGARTLIPATPAAIRWRDRGVRLLSVPAALGRLLPA